MSRPSRPTTDSKSVTSKTVRRQRSIRGVQRRQPDMGDEPSARSRAVPTPSTVTSRAIDLLQQGLLGIHAVANNDRRNEFSR